MLPVLAPDLDYGDLEGVQDGGDATTKYEALVRREITGSDAEQLRSQLLQKLLDEGGVDGIVVGDSASNVMAGHETTLPITLDQMIYHAASVVRAVDLSLIHI